MLEGDNRESRFKAKQTGRKGLNSDQLGLRTKGEIPASKTPVIVDNVVATGTTAKAAVQALGKGVVLGYAYGSNSNPVEGLKLAEPITYDDNGNVISLDERFDVSNPDVRYSINGDESQEYLEIDLQNSKARLKLKFGKYFRYAII